MSQQKELVEKSRTICSVEPTRALTSSILDIDSSMLEQNELVEKSRTICSVESTRAMTSSILDIDSSMLEQNELVERSLIVISMPNLSFSSLIFGMHCSAFGLKHSVEKSRTIRSVEPTRSST